MTAVNSLQLERNVLSAAKYKEMIIKLILVHKTRALIQMILTGICEKLLKTWGKCFV